MVIWIQVRDVRAEHARLAADRVLVIRSPAGRRVFPGAARPSQMTTAAGTPLPSASYSQLFLTLASSQISMRSMADHLSEIALR